MTFTWIDVTEEHLANLDGHQRSLLEGKVRALRLNYLCKKCKKAHCIIALSYNSELHVSFITYMLPMYSEFTDMLMGVGSLEEAKLAAGRTLKELTGHDPNEELLAADPTQERPDVHH